MPEFAQNCPDLPRIGILIYLPTNSERKFFLGRPVGRHIFLCTQQLIMRCSILKVSGRVTIWIMAAQNLRLGNKSGSFQDNLPLAQLKSVFYYASQLQDQLTAA